ncbi:MAG: two-component system, OmpR family, sensor histidine kinase VanS [Tepidanaerobacteraceae bacterium]|nr:two-component system, OmpR family, sensor histidine kinase VanS [Tepidanaerobacteraceae bacterium]
MRNGISIRHKLFVMIIACIFIFAGLQYAANTFFAEKYYISQKKKMLLKTAQKLAELIDEREDPSDFDDESLIYEISTLEKSIGGSIFIGKMDGTLFFPARRGREAVPRPAFTFNPFFSPDNERNNSRRQYQNIRPDPPRIKVKYLEREDDGSFFIITRDPNFKLDTLRYQKTLNNDIVILVWVPMASIMESAAISNRFIAIVGLITAAISGLWALYVAERFTKPILKISQIAKRIANLDFSQKISVKTRDEIGQLSESINLLSEKLSKAIEELNEKNRRLKEDIDREKMLEKMRREFVSSVSHELKTPIFLIQGYAEALKENIAKSEEKRNFYLDVIIEEAEKMDKLVKDLLELSQIEAGMVRINKVRFNLSKLISKITSKYEQIAGEKNVKLTLEAEENLQAFADPERIEQAIVNFINNALDHLDERKIVKIRAKRIEGKIRVSVYNSGKPIPEESLGKIWDSFYKMDKSRSREFGGSGIGLAIVRAIMEAHGGTYGAKNTEGGVEFWIEIEEA